MSVICPVPVLYLPAMQSMHWLSKVACTVLDHLPAGHRVHTVDPTEGAYLPASQGVHIAEGATVVEVKYVAVPKYLPTTQSVQVILPALSASLLSNFPARQSIHDSAPAFEYFPLGHNVQNPGELAPSVVETNPAAHEIHVSVVC